MRFETPMIWNVVLTLFAWIFLSTLACEADAERYAKAEISLDGKTVLEGGTGDNGRYDADEVWDYLKTIKFRATEEFRALDVGGDAQEVVLKSNAPKGELGGIVVDIRYGGKAMTRELILVRVPRDEQGREWRLDPAQVDKLFDRRFIRRSDAARLKNPQSLRR